MRDCRAPLTRETKRLVCPRGHAFDLARSGYVNLLQPQDRRSKSPGDSAEVVAARRRILEHHARPLVDAISRLLDVPANAAVLDAGCGAGEHLAALEQRSGCEAHGVDISLPAIETAARNFPRCHFAVANADRFLPYADGSFDAVMSINARLNPPEFHRLLVPGGLLLISILGADDLRELRSGVEQDRSERTIALFAGGFELLRHERLTHTARLDRSAIADALAAAYRSRRSVDLDEAEVTFSRDVLAFRKVDS